MWNTEELDRINKAEELRISSTRKDGSTSTPVIIWFVRVGDELYGRSVHGDTPWYNAVRNRKVGHISTRGADVDVTFEAPITDGLDEIDAAYLEKYSHYPTIVPGCVNDVARSTTIRISKA